MSSQRRGRRRFVGLAAVGLVVAAGMLAWHHGDSDVLRRLELTLVDARFAIRGVVRPRSNIVIVAFDEKTLTSINRFPIPRIAQARLLNRISRQHPRLVIEDFNFEQRTNPADDDALILALRRASPVVVASLAVGKDGASPVLGGPLGQAAARATPGYAGLAADPGGVYRRVRHDLAGQPTIALAGASLLGHPLGRQAFPGNEAWIDYAGPPGTIPAISAERVLDGRISPVALRGRIVVVGETVPGSQDVHPTPFAHGGLMSGAEIEANALDSVLRGNPLRDVSSLSNDALIVLAAVLVPALTLLRSLSWALIAAAVAFASLLVGAQLAFDAGHIVAVGAIGLALLVSTVATIPVEYAVAIRERRRLHAQFSRFVGPDVVEEVIASADDNGRLPQHVLEATVMFCDLREFTTFAHEHPDDVVQALNAYLGEMTRAILEHKGTIVTYLGDGIMAVFGAPIAHAGHSDLALAAAREMVGPGLERFREAMAAEHGPAGASFNIGIGLNSGPVTSGSIGSGRRMEYAAVGDTTNQASKIEQLTKHESAPILMSESTYEALADRPDGLRRLGPRGLEGIDQPVVIWGLGDLSAPRPSTPPPSEATEGALTQTLEAS